MKKGLFTVTALLAVFAIIGCGTGSDPGSNGTGYDPMAKWIRFTENEMLAAKFYINIAGQGDNPEGTGIVKNADGFYDVTLKTVTSNDSRSSVVWVEFEEIAGEPRAVFRNGWYASLSLPATGVRPVNVQVIPVPAGKKGADGDIAWDCSQDAFNTGDQPATMDGFYVVGDLSMRWATEEPKTVNFIGLAIWLMWAPEGTDDAADYTFTIKDLKVLPHDTSIPDPSPDDLTAWTPEPKTEPADYINFPDGETLRATFYPYNGGNVLNGNTVTVVAPASGRTLVRLLGTNVKWKKGYYLSVTLPDNASKPQKIYSLGTEKDDSDGIWPVADLVEAPDGKFIAGRVDFAWADENFTTEYTGVMLDIYWYGGEEEAMYTFTINAIKVAE